MALDTTETDEETTHQPARTGGHRVPAVTSTSIQGRVVWVTVTVGAGLGCAVRVTVTVGAGLGCAVRVTVTVGAGFGCA